MYVPPYHGLDLVQVHTPRRQQVGNVVRHLDAVPGRGQVGRDGGRVAVVVLADAQVPDQLAARGVLEEEAQRRERVQRGEPGHGGRHESRQLGGAKGDGVEHADSDHHLALWQLESPCRGGGGGRRSGRRRRRRRRHRSCT